MEPSAHPTDLSESLRTERHVIAGLSAYTPTDPEKHESLTVAELLQRNKFTVPLSTISVADLGLVDEPIDVSGSPGPR